MVRAAITKEESSRELKVLRQRVAELEALKAEHQQADKKLLQLEDEQRYKAVFESANDVIVLMDKKGRITDVNDKLREIIGYDKEKLVGKNLSSLPNIITKKSLDILSDNFQKRVAGAHVPPYEIEMVKKNGELLTLEINARAMKKDGRIIGNIAILRDVTERKRAETEHKTIIQTTIDGFWLADMQGRFLDVNDAYCQLVGYNRDELLKMSIPDIEAIEKSEETAARIARIKKVGGDRFETCHRCKDGRAVNVEVSVNYVEASGGRMFVFIRDITERKQAELALQMSEQNFKEAQALGRIGSWEFDFTTQKIDWSDETYRLFERDKALGPPSPEEEAQYYAPEQTRKLREYALRSVETGKEYNYDLTANLPSGKTLLLNASVRPIKDEQGQMTKLFGTVQDITERKQAEQELRASESKYRFLSENMADIAFTVDLNMRTTYVSSSVERVLGFTPEERMRQLPQEQLTPESFKSASEALSRELGKEDKTGKPNNGLFVLELEYYHKDGSIRIMETNLLPIRDEQGKPTGVYGLCHDITEQKLAEKRLEQATQEWRTTFDSITDMVCILDNDSRITRVNMAYANMLKKEPRELIGKACYELIHKTDCPCQDCPHQKTLKTGKPAMREFFEPALGIYIEGSTSPIFNDNGDIKGSVNIMRDISKRKQMEQQLMLTDRLASVGELASGVAHELNNPLTSVIGFSQLLMEGEIPDNIKEDLSLINSEAQRAANVVKNLLTFARKHAAVKQASKMNNIIEDVLKLRAYEQKVNNIEVIKQFASDLPEIMVDYFQIQQVFLNLIINAEFFMTEAHHRGTLTISIEKVDHAVKVSFADDGAGIPRENLKRIFDPFFTTKEVGKGTGLGLSICHGIITEHGGKIYAESEVGKGATFIIELPINGN